MKSSNLHLFVTILLILFKSICSNIDLTSSNFDESNLVYEPSEITDDSEKKTLASLTSSHRTQPSHDYYDHEFRFTRSSYNVSIPEDSRNTYATVIISHKNISIPDPDPGGGQDLPTFSNNSNSKNYKFNNESEARLDEDRDRYVSPYEKMGMYISDPELRVRYKIAHSDEKKIFSVESRLVGNFYFLLIKTRTADLNREKRSEYHLTIRAVIESIKNKNFKLKAKCDVYIHVEDTNDLSPIFFPTHYEVNVTEDTPVDTRLVNVSAFDPDIGLKSEIYYMLASSDTDLSLHFSVHPTLGIVSNTRPFKRPSKQSHSGWPQPYQYKLIILAKDRASHLQRGSSRVSSISKATVLINVLPVNRYSPKMILKQHSSLITRPLSFTSSFDSLSMFDSLSSQVYAIVRVIDEDGEDNLFGKICSLSIVGGNDLDLFQISNSSYKDEYRIELKPFNSTLNLSKKKFDQNLSSHLNGYQLVFNLTLKAIDCGGLFSTQLVNVVLNPFSAKSIFKHSSYSSTDPISSSLFSLIRPTFEKEHYYSEIHEVSLPGTIVTQIKLKSFNDIKSSQELYNNYTSHISNGFPFAKFSLISGDSKTFGITSNGLIFTKVSLDFEKRKEYTLEVAAQLKPSLSATFEPSTTKVHIKIIDDNDHDPVFTNKRMKYFKSSSIIEITFDENKPNGSLVYQVNASDADQNENGLIIFSIVDNPLFSNHNRPLPFTIDPHTGQILTTKRLDYETGPRFYSLIVRASDSGLPFRRQSEILINITINDINDHKPQFEQKDCTAFIPSTVKPWTEIITLSAVDLDIKSEITYHLIESSEDKFSSCFDLNKHTGVLQIICDLNDLIAKKGDDLKQMYINVSASDGQHFANLMPIKIVITNPKSDSSKSSSEILVECKSGSDVGNLKSTIESVETEKPFDTNNIASVLDERLEEKSISDYNLHVPTFPSSSPNEIYIQENVKKGSLIVNLGAQDDDIGYNSMLVWSLNLHSYSNLYSTQPFPFEIDTFDGKIKTIETIDREVQSKFELNVTVCDLGYKPSQYCSSKLLKVYIDDENDNYPTFDRPVYYFSILENSKLATIIANIQASDNDIGVNSVIRYSLLNHQQTFNVDAKTGLLTTKGEIDREKVDRYEIYIKATDSGIPTLSSIATVILEVQDVNDNAPTFKEKIYFIVIREDYPLGALITKLDAYDLDQGKGKRIRYSLFSSLEDEDVFSIDEMTGNIRLAKELDFERKQLYNLTIVAKDGGVPVLSSSASLIVEVADVDENQYPPRFSDIVEVGRVKENSPVGTYVMTVKAVDEDHPPNLDSERAVIYQIVAGDGLGRFAIDEQGKIFTKVILDHETNHLHWLTVVAKDRDAVPKSSHLHVLIEIEDENDNAPITTEPFYFSNILENSSIGTTVLQLHAYDLDSSSSYQSGHLNEFVFQILNALEDCPFEINNTNGLIKTKNELDRETLAQYVLDIKISEAKESLTSGDQRTLSSKTPVIINVLDVNDNEPKFIRSIFRCQAYNNLDRAIPICSVIAYDLDIISDDDDNNNDNDGSSNKSLLYFQLLNGNENNYFLIDEIDGSIYFSPNYTTPKGEYNLMVSVTDKGEPPKSSQVRVVLKVFSVDPNENRTESNEVMFLNDPSESILMVSEDEKIGHMLMVIRTSETGDYPICSHLLESSEKRSFAIVDGALMIAKKLDFESTRVYNLAILITDGRDSNYFNITINVIDVNDNIPHFFQDTHTINVYENITQGTSILTLRVNDIDINDNHAYKIYTTNSPKSLSKFELERWSGILRVKEPLDYELIRQHILVIEASDSRLINSERNGWSNSLENLINSPHKASSHRSFTKVVINILDVNDHAPEFVSTAFEVTLAETSAVGTSVLQVTAIDSDTGDNALISYSIISGNEENTFAIDPELGYIYLTKQLEINRQPEYYLFVKATDHGQVPLASSISVHVIVSLPDNSQPFFENKKVYFDVLENIKIGTIIGSVKAVSRQNLFYEIVSSDSSHFSINMNNGEVYLRKQLDYETCKKFQITISAVNLVRKSDAVEVIINVLDVNDNHPKWNSTYYHGFISESAEIGTLLLNNQDSPLLLKAYDLDSNSNGLVRYSINQLSPQEYFKIDSSTGAITLIKSLDYEKFHEINFTVSVSDLGDPFALKAETDALVVVSIKDVNDCPPVFERSIYQTTLLLPTYSDVSVLWLNTTDCDIDLHRIKTRSSNFPPVIYTLYTTGRSFKGFKINSTTGLITVDQPSLITADIYNLIATAFDGKFTAQTKVTVVCKNITRTSLRFRPSKFFAKVTENVNVAKNVIRLTVTGDKKNDHLAFRILNADSSMFRILPSSGLIRTTGIPFDRERKSRYLLIVEVKSLSNPNRIDHCEVEIRVEDVNDNVPLFVNLPYYFALGTQSYQSEETIGKVQAIDHDVGQNGYVIYSIISGDKKNLFKIDPEKGHISLSRPLDEFDQAEYNITVQASDSGLIPLKSTAKVLIKVISGEMPLFAKQYYSVNIPEDQSPLVPFITIDVSSPHGRQLIYSITSGNELEEFTLDYNTDPAVSNSACVVSVVEKLDRETISEYQLIITAIDSVSGVSSMVPLQVIVEDVNDNAPRFNQSMYTASVLESAYVGTQVLQVFAYDQDAPNSMNSQIRYHLESNSSVFTIDSESGVIYLRQKLDFETTPSYHLVVVASDLGSPMLTSSEHVYVNVIDVNDNVPFFVQSSYSATIDENVSRDHFVLKITAYDPDSSDNEKKKLRYKIISGNINEGFKINETTGIITTLNTPRRFKNSSSRSFEYLLNVSVSDEIYINYTLVYIKVAFANNHNPTFTRSVYNAIVSESVPIATQVVHVKAVDEDQGSFGEVTYSIFSQYALNWFKINPHTGVISTVDKIDREKHHFFVMTVMATDGGNRIGVSNVRITVTNSNDNAPEFLVNEYKSVICSDLPIAFNVIPVIAVDKDVVSTKNEVVYSIYESSENMNSSRSSLLFFGIHRESGHIFVARDLTSHADEIYQFFVKAVDTGHLENVVPVTIQVMGPCKMKNDHMDSIEVSVSESLKSGSMIVGINLNDTQNLDLELIQSSNRKTESSILSQFRIDSQGKIYLISPLDYEESTKHVLVVKVTHKSKFTVRYLNVIINVLNDNDNTPQFDSDLYFLEISEEQDSSYIMRIHAFDLDLDYTAREIQYSIKTEESDKSTDYFDLNPSSGWLKLVRPLDRENNQWHNLTIWISDGQNFNHTKIFIKVMDSNDNPPKFDHSSYSAAIYEDSPIGIVVIKVEAVDADELSKFQLRYYIVEGDPHNQFGITDTGELFVNRELDREKLDNYRLKILVTDSKFITETQIIVTILDVNDNGPNCKKSEYFEVISEDVANGSNILIIEAEDADENENAVIYFSLSEGEDNDSTKNNSLPFVIDQQTGLLTTRALLDREKKSSYYFQARAHDNINRDWFCTSSIKILISDVNDNSPAFTENEYTVNVPEDSKLGIIVGKVHAIDPDLGINRQVRYSFIDSAENTFIIDNKTGIVRLNKPLDREAVDSFNLTVSAFDSGTPLLSSTKYFIVKVQDVNDNAPEFTRTRYEAALFENATIGSEVVSILATSKDIGINAHITYTIILGNDDNTFSIHPSSGIISLSKPLDYESIKQYFLTIKGEDAGIPPLSSETKVNIDILDVNDNAPVFSQKSYSAVIKEDTLIGEKIIPLIAIDADSGPNSELNYYFKNKSMKTSKFKEFEIETKTGIILVAAQLDRETTSSYIMEVICSDEGNLPLSTSVLITIEISDVNDNAPIFDQKNYSLYVQRRDQARSFNYNHRLENKKIDDPILKFIISDPDSSSNAGPFALEIISGNEPEDTFRINEQESELRIGSKFALSKAKYFVIKIQATDSGTPSLSSTCWVHITVIEESHYPPVIEGPNFVSVVTYFDQFQGGILAQIEATDRDTYDKLKFDIANSVDKDSFGIDPEDGTLMAASGLDAGIFQVNVSVTDGKFTTFENVEVKVISISEDALTNSLFISFNQVSPKKFLAEYQRPFFKALRNLLNVRMKDILLISIQSAKERYKRDIDSVNITDILFAVEKPGFKMSHSSNGFYPIQALRKKIIEKQSVLENSVGLEILEIGRNRCEEPEDSSSPLTCVHGTCRDDVILDENQMTSHMFEKASLVLPIHERKVYCSCHPGFGGETCKEVVNECARTSPCPSFKECSLASSPLGYVCKCPFGKTGITCNQNNAKYCHNEKDVSFCYQEINPVSFTGTGYARYTLTRKIMERLSLRFKSLQLKSVIMFSSGSKTYSILEIAGGYVQYRFDCGSGESVIRVETIQINDGKWHEVMIERKRNSASLTLDGNYITAGQAPDSQDIPNLEETEVYFGAEVKARQSEFGGEDTSNGFVGCLDNIRLDNELLPLNQKASSPVANLKLLANVGFGGCRGVSIKRTKACECLNGGSCKLSSNGSYICVCPTTHKGPKCEIDITKRHCSPNPCQNGGVCVILHSINSYECSCPSEFGGLHCEKSKLCSESVKCQNFGKCENLFCKCKSGYGGYHCEEDIDECALSPSVCPPQASCVNLNGSFLCFCSKDSTTSVCSSYNDSVFPFYLLNLRIEDLLFPAICVLIFLISVCFIFVCCYCHKKCGSKKRNSRAPNNIYRDAIDGNEFLLKNSNITEPPSNMQRFSKLSGMELPGLNPNESFSSDLHPNHHFHQALRASTRSSSYSDMNNFDALAGYENSADDISSTKEAHLKGYQSKRFRNSKMKDSSTMKGSSQFVNSTNSSQFPLNTESKIQNIYSLSCGNSACKFENASTSLCDSELNVFNEEQSNASNNAEGYHWDCYDLEEEMKPISNDIHDIRQVSANEVRDSESNSDNSQIELITNPDLNSLAAKRMPKTRFGTYTKAKSDIANVKDKNDKVNLLESYNHQINDIEYVDESLPTSPIKYSSHLDSYLPTFEMNNTEMDSSNPTNKDNIKMNIEENIKPSGKRLDDDSESELTVIKSDNSRQSTFV